MTTEIALKDMEKMADSIARSGLFGMKNADQALALMLVAQSEGTHPATITQDYDIIQGRACRKTHSVMARFQQMGGSVEWIELSDTKAEGKFSHPAGGALTMSWTLEQAKKIGLTKKDNWINYPRAMLRARVIAEGVRAVYPAAIGGMMVSEEAQDLPVNVINMTRPAAALVRDEEDDGYDEYESATLPLLEAAARNGGLEAAFKALLKSPHKARLWTTHSVNLKALASEAIEDIEVVA
jgi:hypothetical protein